MHYISMISDNPSMVFGLELMMRTVKKFSGDRPITFSVVVNGNSREPVLRPLILTKRSFHNDYISKYADVYDCPYHWTLHAPCRWFVEPKGETCVFIDTDIIACRDLTPLYDLDKNTVYGVPAHFNPINADQWASIGMSSEEMKFYFNFGMVVVPSKYVKSVGETMMDKVPDFMKLFREVEYFAAQIALSHTLKEIGVTRLSLPKQFNWLDLHPYPNNPKEILFMHYVLNRKHVTDKYAACSLHGNEYAKMISESAKQFYHNNMFI